MFETKINHVNTYLKEKQLVKEKVVEEPIKLQVEDGELNAGKEERAIEKEIPFKPNKKPRKERKKRSRKDRGFMSKDLGKTGE